MPTEETLEVPTEELNDPTDFDDLLDEEPASDPTPVPDQQEPESVPVEEPVSEEEAPAEEPPAETPVEETPAEPNPLETLTTEYNQYLTDDMVAGFAENPKSVLSNIASQIHHAVFQSLAEGFTQALPSQIQQVTAQVQEQDSFRNDFFTAHPHLADPKYQEALTNTLNLYVQQNPESSREQIIKAVGQIATISLNVQAQKKPAAPAATPAFTPASPGGNGPASTETPSNEYAAFYEEIHLDP